MAKLIALMLLLLSFTSVSLFASDDEGDAQKANSSSHARSTDERNIEKANNALPKLMAKSRPKRRTNWSHVWQQISQQHPELPYAHTRSANEENREKVIKALLKLIEENRLKRRTNWDNVWLQFSQQYPELPYSKKQLYNIWYNSKRASVPLRPLTQQEEARLLKNVLEFQLKLQKNSKEKIHWERWADNTGSADSLRATAKSALFLRVLKTKIWERSFQQKKSLAEANKNIVQLLSRLGRVKPPACLSEHIQSAWPSFREFALQVRDACHVEFTDEMIEFAENQFTDQQVQFSSIVNQFRGLIVNRRVMMEHIDVLLYGYWQARQQANQDVGESSAPKRRAVVLPELTLYDGAQDNEPEELDPLLGILPDEELSLADLLGPPYPSYLEYAGTQTYP